jgi:hypothetical protein
MEGDSWNVSNVPWNVADQHTFPAKNSGGMKDNPHVISQSQEQALTLGSLFAN